MKYLVMECHPGYAVVLDEEGRFLKAANMHYTVGQTVEQIYEMRMDSFEAGEEAQLCAAPDLRPSMRTRGTRRMFSRIAAIAACFCIAVLGAGYVSLSPYGSVRMQINPDTRITVNRLDYVLSIDPLNRDGQELIADYDYDFQKLDAVSDDLVDRAIEMGYLNEGGQVHLTVESDHENWRTVTEKRLVIELEVHTKQTISVQSETIHIRPADAAASTPFDPGASDNGPEGHFADDADDDSDAGTDGGLGYDTDASPYDDQ